MARLPSAADIQRRPGFGSAPAISAPKVDYSPLAKGAESLGAGISAAGRGVSAFAEAQSKAEDHELERRLLDFRLETEMELEEQKRQMPVGGSGYTAAWSESYRERAKAFVGEKYANIPERLRDQIDTKLTQHEVLLHERAQRDEYAEHDRQTLADLETTLGRTRSAVEADPGRLDEMHGEGARLIDGAALTPAMRSAFAKKYRAELEEAAAGAIADSVRDAGGYERAKALLAPHRAERVTARDVSAAITSGVSKGRAAGWAATNSTFRGLDGYQKAALVALMEADGADGDDARNALGAMINRAAKGGEDLGAHVSQKIYQPTIEPAQEKRIARLMASPQFGELTEWAKRRASGQEPDPVNGATHFLAPERTMLALEAREPQKYRSWRKWTGYDEASGGYRGVITRDKSHAFLAPDGTAAEAGEPVSQADAYDGPFQNLSLAKRRALWGRVEATMGKIRTGVETAIKSYEEGALNGRLPSDQELSAIERQVAGLDDDVLRAKYAALIEKASFSSRFLKMPPAVATSIVQRLEQQAATVGSSKELEDRIQWARKNDEALRKAVNDDPMSWVVRNGVQVPMGVQPGQSFEQAEAAAMGAPAAVRTEPLFQSVELDRIDFNASDISARLAVRLQQATAVGDYYSQPPQVFTTKERDALRDTLRQGGRPMLAVMGHIAKSASEAGVDPADVMREFSKDAPELAVIGDMVVSGADPRILETAATALAWRTKQGDKFESTIDKVQSKPDLAEYADVLATQPTKVDAVRHTANIIYEYEARRQGLKEFSRDAYVGVVRKLMGETADERGTLYGGVGKQGTGWADGKWGSGGWFGNTPKVLVPPGVRQDSFDDMVGAMRARDLADNPPVDGAGKPLTMGQIRSASWVSLGPGRYALELKRDADGTRAVAVDRAGQTYVLDVRPMLDTIRKRRPDIFRGYDGLTRRVVEPE